MPPPAEVNSDGKSERVRSPIVVRGRQDPRGLLQPYAMARLVGLKDQYRVACANDPDSDRRGIVTPSAGLMNPNHYLAVAIGCLLTHRPHWPASAMVGKTLVSSSIIDRVVNRFWRRLSEVPTLRSMV